MLMKTIFLLRYLQKYKTMYKNIFFFIFFGIIYYNKHEPLNIDKEINLPLQPINTIYFKEFDSKPEYTDKEYRVRPKYIKVD